MCAICHHPHRDAIEAALEAGRPPRAVAADYPDISKSALDRHRKRCAGTAPTSSPTTTTVTPLTVRRRTRAQTDEAERFAIALRMKARGCSRSEIGRALSIHPSTVTDLLNHANAAALERVRSETVEDLIVQRRAERDTRAQKLAVLLERAELRGDVPTQISVLRELRHEGKEDREWMEALGAFDHYRIPSMQEQAEQRGGDLSRDARDLLEGVAALFGSGPEIDILPEPNGTAH